jgi:hypothetical protein
MVKLQNVPICYDRIMKRIILKVNELKKYKTIKAVADGKKKKQRASVELGIIVCQVNRLLNAYKENGKQAFIHGNRGRKTTKAIDSKTQEIP